MVLLHTINVYFGCINVAGHVVCKKSDATSYILQIYSNNFTLYMSSQILFLVYIYDDMEVEAWMSMALFV